MGDSRLKRYVNETSESGSKVVEGLSSEGEMRHSVGAFIRYYQSSPVGPKLGEVYAGQRHRKDWNEGEDDRGEQVQEASTEEKEWDDENGEEDTRGGVATFEDWQFLTTCGYSVKGPAVVPPALPGEQPPTRIVLNLSGVGPDAGGVAEVEAILPHPFGPVLKMPQPAEHSALPWAPIGFGEASSEGVAGGSDAVHAEPALPLGSGSGLMVPGLTELPWTPMTVDEASDGWAAHRIVGALHARFVQAFKEIEESSFRNPANYSALALAADRPGVFARLYGEFVSAIGDEPPAKPTPEPHSDKEEPRKPLGWDLREFLTVADPTEEADRRIHAPKPKKKSVFRMVGSVYVQGRTVSERYEEYRKIVDDLRIHLSPEMQSELYDQVVCGKEETEARLEHRRKILEAIEVDSDERFDQIVGGLFGYGMSEDAARRKLDAAAHYGEGGPYGEVSEEHSHLLAAMIPALKDEFLRKHDECKKRQGENCDDIIYAGAEFLERTSEVIAQSMGAIAKEVVKAVGSYVGGKVADYVIEEVAPKAAEPVAEAVVKHYATLPKTAEEMRGPELDTSPTDEPAAPPE